MPEIYYEESVSQRDERTAKKFYIVFTVVAVLCICLAVYSMFSIYVALTFSDSDVPVRIMVIYCVLFGALLIASIVFAVLLLKKRHNFYISYDYIFVSGDLRISKVFHRRRRKDLYKISEGAYIKIGRVGSQSYLKLKASPENKEEILTPNREAGDGKEFFYVYASSAVGKRILVLECRETMIANILRYVNKTILESEFNSK